MTFYSHAYPKANKEHRCADCGRTIRKGEIYRRGSGMDGTAWTWRECEHCTILATYLGYLYDLEEYGAEDFFEWDPESVEQWRIKVQFRKKWTKTDGTLYPAPYIERLYRENSSWPYAVKLHIGVSGQESPEPWTSVVS